MQIQINTDHNINGHEILITKIRSGLESALSRMSGHITRIEVHLSDENGKKRGLNDKRCVMEARLEGRQPVAVTQQSATLDEAVEGATNKLVKLIENAQGKLQSQKSRGRGYSPHMEQNSGDLS